jgi:hypothetical protein
LDLDANHQVLKDKQHNNENGRKYGHIPKNPYQNLMLEKQVLKIEKRPTRHKLFLPQEVVRREIWTSGIQRRHYYKQ